MKLKVFFLLTTIIITSFFVINFKEETNTKDKKTQNNSLALKTTTPPKENGDTSFRYKILNTDNEYYIDNIFYKKEGGSKKKLIQNNNIVTNKPKNIIKVYGNKLAEIIKEEGGLTESQKDVQTIANFISNPNSTTRVAMKKISYKNKRQADKIKNLNVPKEFSVLNKKLSSNYQDLSEEIILLTENYSSNLFYKTIEKYNEKAINLSKTFLEISKKFKSLDAGFKYYDLGYIFMF